MPEMKSPEGDEHEIPDAGVASLKRLGWTLVHQPKPAAKKAAEPKKSK